MEYLRARFNYRELGKNDPVVQDGVCLGCCLAWLNWVVDLPAHELIELVDSRLTAVIKSRATIVQCQVALSVNFNIYCKSDSRSLAIPFDISAKLFSLIVYSNYKEDYRPSYISSSSSNALYNELLDTFNDRYKNFLIHLEGKEKDDKWGHSIAGIRLFNPDDVAETIAWLIFDSSAGEFLVPNEKFSGWLTKYTELNYFSTSRFAVFHVERYIDK